MAAKENVCTYIDVDGSFRPQRLMSIIARFEGQFTDAKDNICYSRAYSYDHMVYLLHQAPEMMCKDRFSLLIVDSVASLYRGNFSNENVRESTLGRILSMLLKLANQVLSEKLCFRQNKINVHFFSLSLTLLLLLQIK